MSEIKQNQTSGSDVDELCVNVIRVLAAEMVQKAKSGHPGAPMGMAPIAHVLFSKIMSFDPLNPAYPNRDRFVLSNGHACALQYVMLHLCGYKSVSMNQLKQFRQLGSKTPGHPEAHMTEGVEVTTGPLGQGIANGVGMAMAAKHLGATYNKPGFPLFDHSIFVFTGDGCLQEGVSAEASSLAGHLKLGNLIVCYDDNSITIDGHTDLSFSENVVKRYESYGWHTLVVENADSDLSSIEAAIKAAKKVTDKPTLIAMRTTIGYGSKKSGTHGVHGSPLGMEDLAGVKQRFGLSDKSFHIPEAVADYYDSQVTSQGPTQSKKWAKMLQSYVQKYPKLGAELQRRMTGKLPAGWETSLAQMKFSGKKATRALSGQVLNVLAKDIVDLIGGSADLTPSNKTQLKGVRYEGDFQGTESKDGKTGAFAGRYLRFGVREHGMAAIGNGIASYKEFVPFTATFLNFIEYAFPAVRLSALSHFQQLYIMTHDSVGLGEDGPTHQPIEAVALCRATPNLLTFRPADGPETVGSYQAALKFQTGPSVLVLSRQGLPTLEKSSVQNVARGGYVAFDSGNGTPGVTLVATGSEVSLALEAAKLLSESKGSGSLGGVRVVSMPCTELFDAQTVSYRRQVIPPGSFTVSVEALATQGWSQYAHVTKGIDSFGVSAPGSVAFDHFGFTAKKLAAFVVDAHDSYTAAAKETGASGPGLLPCHFGLRSAL